MEEQLKDHEKRIGDLEKKAIKVEDKIGALIEKLDTLTKVLTWVGMTSAGVMITLFIFMIEHNLK